MSTASSSQSASQATSLRPAIQFTLGDFELSVIDTGRFALDGGAMFGVVPRALWEKLLPPDDKHRVPLAMNCLLIQYQGKNILYETGIGTKFSEKYVDMYGIEIYPNMTGQLPIEYGLKQIGIQPEDIDEAYFSHLHFDHAGGATQRLADGSIEPTFKNAQYFVHKGEWEQANCPHERCKASYLKENFAPLLQSGQLTLFEGDTHQILPGLSLRISGGHTPNHVVLILDLPKATEPHNGFIYWGDLLPTRHHIRIPFVMGYDEYPLQTMAAKRALLKEAAEKNWLHIFEHELDTPVVTLTPDEKPDTYVLKTFSSTLFPNSP